MARKLAVGRRTMVILDSDHEFTQVRREMELYSDLVSPGCYLIVEDTNVNGHPVAKDHGPGPYEAVMDFLQERNDFEVDRDQHKFLMSFQPNGYLKKL
jgi:cephalosporin hydroxylase